MLSIPQLNEDVESVIASFLGFEGLDIFNLSKEAKDRIIKQNSVVEISTEYGYMKGTKIYRTFGKLHRDNDLPAVEHTNGSKVWYFRGKRHREGDLPAVESIYNSSGAYVCGEVNGRPVREYIEGTECVKVWYKNGKRHRDGGLPALDHPKKTHWYKNGLLYREDGPAVINYNSPTYFYVNGVRHRKDRTTAED